jgi:hypothetical protein
MPKHLKDNIRTYLELIAVCFVLLGYVAGYGQLRGQSNRNTVDISENSCDNKLSHDKILREIKELSDSLNRTQSGVDVLKAQNSFIIKMLEKKL